MIYIVWCKNKKSLLVFSRGFWGFFAGLFYRLSRPGGIWSGPAHGRYGFAMKPRQKILSRWPCLTCVRRCYKLPCGNIFGNRAYQDLTASSMISFKRSISIPSGLKNRCSEGLVEMEMNIPGKAASKAFVK